MAASSLPAWRVPETIAETGGRQAGDRMRESNAATIAADSKAT